MRRTTTHGFELPAGLEYEDLRFSLEIVELWLTIRDANSKQGGPVHIGVADLAKITNIGAYHLDIVLRYTLRNGLILMTKQPYKVNGIHRSHYQAVMPSEFSSGVKDRFSGCYYHGKTLIDSFIKKENQ